MIDLIRRSRPRSPRIGRLLLDGDRVDVGRLRGDGQADAGTLGLDLQRLQQAGDALRTTSPGDIAERVDPVVGLQPVVRSGGRVDFAAKGRFARGLGGGHRCSISLPATAKSASLDETVLINRLNQTNTGRGAAWQCLGDRRRRPFAGSSPGIERSQIVQCGWLPAIAVRGCVDPGRRNRAANRSRRAHCRRSCLRGSTIRSTRRVDGAGVNT